MCSLGMARSKKKSEQYIDENGYLREGKSHSTLVHRKIAYNHIYKKNKDKFDHPFSYYQVHHKDHNKRNNHSSNLQIVTKEEHERIHGINTNSKSIGKVPLIISAAVIVSYFFSPMIVDHYGSQGMLEYLIITVGWWVALTFWYKYLR